MGHRRRIIGEAEPRRGDVNLPTGLFPGIHLGLEVCAHLGEGPRGGQMWGKKPDNWSEGRQRPRRTDLHK